MTMFRRTVLQGIGAGLTGAVCHSLWAPRHARASDLALSDRIDILYSNQFVFNDRGEPEVSIGLRHSEEKVRISAPGGLQVLPSGGGGTTIDGGEVFDVRLDRGVAAEESFAVIVEELAGASALKPELALKRWRALGLDPTPREVGTVFGVRGRVVDNRRSRITVGTFSSESVAESYARELKDKHGALGSLHPMVTRRATGTLTAVDVASGVSVRAEGVLWLAPRKQVPLLVHDSTSGAEANESGSTYWGQIYVAIDRTGRLSVVNLVSETELLAGLVPAEIYASAPMDALKAQAVAARGQLVSKIGTRHLADPFLLCADQHCQVYAGRGREHPRTTKAVRETSGLIAMKPRQTQLVDTVYSANSGGHTEDNDKVWPGQPDEQLRGRADPLVSREFQRGIDADNLNAWLRSSPSSYSRPDGQASLDPYRWTAAIDPHSLAGARGVPADFGTVRALEVLTRGRSGRALSLRVHGEARSVDIHGELRIRQALGGLRSSMFVVEGERDRYGRLQLLGGGHGHGVGLCQHGAMGMANAGKSCAEILRHYYVGAELTELW